MFPFLTSEKALGRCKLTDL